MQGVIFDIQRFSIHDGPGIRTTVFLKGCPMRCAWCQNPEGISPQPTTPDQAVDSQDLIEELLSDRVFYEASGGGVTLSGGEPLAQPRFAAALLRALRERGVHTVVETALGVRPEAVEALRNLVDLWIVDLKTSDSASHQRWTGVSSQAIWDNLRLLASSGASLWLRRVLVPGVNDGPEDLHDMSRSIASLPASARVERVQLLPLNPLAAGKYKRLVLPWPFAETRTDPHHLAAAQAMLDHPICLGLQSDATRDANASAPGPND